MFFNPKEAYLQSLKSNAGASKNFQETTEGSTASPSRETINGFFRERREAALRAFRDQKKLYDILAIAPSATEDQIKRAFRQMSLRYHPDKCGGMESDLYLEILAAYKILGNPQSRKLYDEFGVITET